MNTKKRRKHSWQPFTAGILVVMMLVSGFVYYDHNRVQRPSSTATAEELRDHYRAHQCQPGSRKTLPLADGTQVTLNGQTTLYVPNDYGRNGSRTLILNGEAFFEIPRSRDLFTIKSDKLITTGYGGSVRVRTAENQAGATVHVLNGQFTVKKPTTLPPITSPKCWNAATKSCLTATST
ncbi:FecR family protein [Chitinophaga sedimenti]|uniref:FecR domain-containing protein n=1 Tax=Chitinophaga sedimenti TaxID=2033606 RepID=UPI0020049455|nr:FecR family protein [Chitinophaga sedimenti]MCK7556705.1 FecR family protein [Chitinophaga sedimenti]